MTEFMRIFAEVLKFAQSPEALRGRAAFARARDRRLSARAFGINEKARNTKSKRKRIRMFTRAVKINGRAFWWRERAAELDRRAEERGG
jgi:hypothetical protein